jgi:hypothetical protein
MSGGHFDYKQYEIVQIADEIDLLIDSGEYSPEVIMRFRTAVDWLRQTELAVQRIDWLVSADDGEDDFIRRWDEEVLGGGSVVKKSLTTEEAG